MNFTAVMSPFTHHANANPSVLGLSTFLIEPSSQSGRSSKVPKSILISYDVSIATLCHGVLMAPPSPLFFEEKGVVPPWWFGKTIT